jgi:hypothetical protein
MEFLYLDRVTGLVIFYSLITALAAALLRTY